MIRAESLPLRRPRAPSRGLLAPVLLLLAPAAVGMMLVRAPYVGRLGAGAFGLAALVVISLQSGKIVVYASVIWLTFLGLIRRLLIPFIGWPQFDPLLLIAPISAALVWYTSRDKRPERTPMSVLATILFLLAIAQIANPASGNILTGVFGSLFWLTPLMWFFVGRTLDRSSMDGFFRLVAVLLVPVTIHGLLHTWGYFFPFEYTWVGVSNFGESIFINGFNIRPFSSLVSPQEYGFYLAFGLIVVWCRILAERERRGRRLLLFGAAFFALFLQGTRTVFLFFGLALVLTTVLRARLLGWKLFAGGLVACLMVLAGMHATRPGQEAASPSGGSRVNMLATHTINGLLNPASTTAPQHLDLIAAGISAGFDRPFGLGVGSQTLVEAKIDEDRKTTVENDVAAVFAVFGLIGGLIYVTFMMMAGTQALRRYRTTMRIRGRPDALSLIMLGTLMAFLTQWWAGQMYAASALLWLVLGFLSRPINQDFSGSAFEEQHANA